MLKKRDKFDTKDIKQLSNDMKGCVSDIKNEVAEHLDSINENTNEIQANYQFISEINAKVDKLNERLDNIQLFLKGLASADAQLIEGEDQNFEIKPLTSFEKSVFLMLYTSGNIPLTYKDISERLSKSETVVRDCILNMIEKGIPLVKEYRYSKAFLKIDKRFRDQQAKNNIVKLDQTFLDF